MIKNIKIELIVLCLLILNLFLSSGIDSGFYNFFKNYNHSLDVIYLKKFFTNLTELGDSFWFFLISIIGYFTCYFLFKTNNQNLNYFFSELKNFFIFLFSSILISGILTQLIKHIIARPRPNHALEDGWMGMDFFSFNSAFHSFPSGHTSTIFAVALSLGLFIPKIKYFFLFYASLVGISRIVVGAHYLTDVVGGVAVAFIGYKITIYIFKKINCNQNIKEIRSINNSSYLLSLMVVLIAMVFISIGSSLDIFISSMFYYGEKNFTLQSFYIITIIARKVFLPFLILYLLFFPSISKYWFINKIYLNYNFTFKKIVFIFASTIINNVIIVNLVLKNFWGRARPNDILELDGNGVFSPWYMYSNACTSNCSFVSGDSSVGFSIIIFYFITKNSNFLWLALFSGFFLGTIRILEGGHFLSDILMSCFLIFILTGLQYNFYDKKFK